MCVCVCVYSMYIRTSYTYIIISLPLSLTLHMLPHCPCPLIFLTHTPPSLPPSLTASSEDHQPAQDFFDKVMNESQATILWPTKLKIGAKSPKDPNVKLIGTPSAIAVAKELILRELDTKVRTPSPGVDVMCLHYVHLCMYVHLCTCTYVPVLLYILYT